MLGFSRGENLFLDGDAWQASYVLDGEALAELNRSGLLQAAVLVMHSLGNVGKMIDMKKRHIAASAPNAPVVQ